jgi:hypothetical protein
MTGRSRVRENAQASGQVADLFAAEHPLGLETGQETDASLKTSCRNWAGVNVGELRPPT